MRLIDRLQDLIFRRRSDGEAPIVLDRRRIFILPSRTGLLYALALLVMLIGAINYNLALGHALVFLLASLGLTGMVHSFRNLHRLRLLPGRAAPVHVGETAEFELTLENDRPYARRALVFAAVAELPVSAAVAADGRTTLALPLPAQRRGWLALPPVRLDTRYPLGLFTAWSQLRPAMRCLVYPSPIFTPLPASRPLPSGSARHGEGGQEDFAGFRERQPADSLRHIAWKASIRQGDERPLLIKEFAGGSDSELCLDWAATDPALPAETRLSLLAGWVIEASQRQLAFALTLPGVDIPAASGREQQRRCLEALALYPV